MEATTMTHTTREAWLTAGIEMLRPHFAAHGAELPATRVSVGWPGGRGKKAHTIGQCWPPTLSADGTAEIFISPAIQDPQETIATLAHELIHAWDKNQHGHKGPFVTMMRAIGLEGKPTASVAGPMLAALIGSITTELGHYPHAALSDTGRKKQTTRMIKLECPECGYTIRTTRRWIAVGMPTCPCGTEFNEPFTF